MKTCQWIYGDPRVPGWHFCEKPVRHLEESWCKEHHAEVYQVETKRKLTRAPQRAAA